MPHRLPNVAVLATLLLLSACRPQVMPAPAETAAPPSHTPGSRPVATLGPDDAVANAIIAIEPVVIVPPAPKLPVATAFDPASVPESAATLPPFPFLPAPDELTGLYDESQRAIAFDREHLIAGDSVIAVEGRVFRQRYRLSGGAREYSEVEFHRNYADAIAALGGVEVSRVQFTPRVHAAFGGRAAVDRHYHGACASHDCENHSYLIRQDGKQYWALVSSGGIPLHGQVTLIEREVAPGSWSLGDDAADRRGGGPPPPQRRLSGD